MRLLFSYCCFVLSLHSKKIKYFLLASCLGFLPFSSQLGTAYSLQKDSEVNNILNSQVAFESRKNTEFESENNSELLEKDFYLIGPGDVLQLTLIDAPEFSGEYSVLNDGTITLPLVGNVNLNNLSLEQASNMIQANYQNELLRPELYLTIKVPRPKLVSVIGEIERPGIYSLTNSETTNLNGGQQISNSGLPTVVDAIQKAGGITQSANLEKVIVIRRLPGIEKELKMTEINLIDLIFEGDHEQNLYLFDGDVIRVSTASKTPANLMKVAQANLSPSTIKVRVIGQVSSPGELTLSANTPLNQAVLSAGGPLPWKGNKGNVTLLRVNNNGTITKKKYKINLKAGVSDENNPPLRNRDIVTVSSTALNSISSGLGAFVEPISPVISAITLLKLINN